LPSSPARPYLDEQTIKTHPGSFLFGPKDVPHAYTVDSGPARLLFVLSPAGMEGLIREMGEPAGSLSIPPQPEAPPDEAEMERMATSLPDMEWRYSVHRGSRNAPPPPVRARALRLGPYFFLTLFTELP
jgi:hypothetical protein